MFQLLQGHSAETSGGLLICLPREQAAAYCKVIITYLLLFEIRLIPYKDRNFNPNLPLYYEAKRLKIELNIRDLKVCKF